MIIGILILASLTALSFLLFFQVFSLPDKIKRLIYIISFVVLGWLYFKNLLGFLKKSSFFSAVFTSISVTIYGVKFKEGFFICFYLTILITIGHIIFIILSVKLANQQSTIHTEWDDEKKIIKNTTHSI